MASATGSADCKCGGGRADYRRAGRGGAAGGRGRGCADEKNTQKFGQITKLIMFLHHKPGLEPSPTLSKLFVVTTAVQVLT